MSMSKKRELVMSLYLERYSSYSIHLRTGLSFKMITGIIREDEVAKKRHKELLKSQENERAYA